MNGIKKKKIEKTELAWLPWKERRGLIKSELTKVEAR